VSEDRADPAEQLGVIGLRRDQPEITAGDAGLVVERVVKGVDDIGRRSPGVPVRGPVEPRELTVRRPRRRRSGRTHQVARIEHQLGAVPPGIRGADAHLQGAQLGQRRPPGGIGDPVSPGKRLGEGSSQFVGQGLCPGCHLGGDVALGVQLGQRPRQQRLDGIGCPSSAGRRLGLAGKALGEEPMMGRDRRRVEQRCARADELPGEPSAPVLGRAGP